MAYEVRHRTTFRDVDIMKHVNNATYFTWMETARTEYYAKLSGLKDMSLIDLIVAHAACDYLRGVRYGEEVAIRVWPSRIGTTSWDFSYEMAVGREAVARGLTVQVSFDYAKGTKQEIPAGVRRRLEADLEPAPPSPKRP